VDERELTEIESRVAQYPAQARSDILRLTQAMRKLSASTAPAAAPSLSHLYDSLTGLLNGGAYGVRFAMARARATRFRKIFAVMSVDVSFGTTGSAAGAVGEDERDLMIKHVASRLEASVRATDTLARIGDESFAVILEDLTHAGHAERVKQIVLDALAEPLVIDGRTLAPQISVGIDFYPSPDQGTQGPPVYN
jgi:diguanylate cyclase (GGDEF)-like protein